MNHLTKKMDTTSAIDSKDKNTFVKINDKKDLVKKNKNNTIIHGDVEENNKKKCKINKEDICILYSYWRSSCSWRIRICLEIKKIKHEYKPIHLIKDGGEHYKNYYTNINPNQRVPTLFIHNKMITQSSAILEYLEEMYPNPPLLPIDPYERAKIREICALIGSDIQPLQNLSVLKKISNVTEGNDEKKNDTKMNWAKYWIIRGLKVVEKLVDSTAGNYCFGDKITLADLYLIPQIYNAKRFNIDLNIFPMILKITSNLEKHDSFIQTHPSKMPDAIVEQ